MGHRIGWAALILMASPPANAQDEAFAPTEVTWPIPHAARPLNLVEGLFRLDFFAAGGLVDRKDVAVELSAGAGYGVSDDLEVGLVLVNAVVSPATDTGLVEPSGYLRYRLGSGLFQIAGEIRGQVPTNGRFGFWAATPALLSIADLIRVDVRPEIRAVQQPDWTTSWGVDGAVSLQLGPRFRLFGGARLSDGLSGEPVPFLVQGRGGAAFTFVEGKIPSGDLELEVRAPARRLGNISVRRDLSTDWFVLIAYRPFYRSEGSRSVDPFADPDVPDWSSSVPQAVP